MGDEMEDKICDLYDLYVDVLIFASKIPFYLRKFSRWWNHLFAYILCYIMVAGAGG